MLNCQRKVPKVYLIICSVFATQRRHMARYALSIWVANLGASDSGDVATRDRSDKRRSLSSAGLWAQPAAISTYSAVESAIKIRQCDLG
jgi:hypothetical protein